MYHAQALQVLTRAQPKMSHDVADEVLHRVLHTWIRAAPVWRPSANIGQTNKRAVGFASPRLGSVRQARAPLKAHRKLLSRPTSIRANPAVSGQNVRPHGEMPEQRTLDNLVGYHK